MYLEWEILEVLWKESFQVVYANIRYDQQSKQNDQHLFENKYPTFIWKESFFFLSESYLIMLGRIDILTKLSLLIHVYGISTPFEYYFISLFKSVIFLI